MEDLGHQKKVRERYRDKRCWGLLWDCGTGKTRAAIEIVEDKAEAEKDSTVLIVCPAVLMRQWKDAIVTHGTKQSKSIVIRNEKLKTKAGAKELEEFMNGN